MLATVAVLIIKSALFLLLENRNYRAGKWWIGAAPA
jgi:hypothetical protein